MRDSGEGQPGALDAPGEPLDAPQAPAEIFVDIASIAIRPEWQPRGPNLDGPTIRKYARAYENGAQFPPLLIARVGGPEVQGYTLLDGWHRRAALLQLGRDDALCELREVATEAEAAWLACAANLHHGLPLAPAAFREAFRAYVRADRHWKDGKRRARATRAALKSYREIAAELGGTRSHTTISNWMRRDFPRIARLYGGGQPWGPQPATDESASVPGGAEGGDTAAAKALRERAAVTVGALASIRATWNATASLSYRRAVAGAVYELAELVKAAGLYAPPEPEEPPDF